MKGVLFLFSFFLVFVCSGQEAKDHFYETRDRILELGPYADSAELNSLYKKAFVLAGHANLEEALAQLFVMYGARHIGITPNLDTAFFYLSMAEEISETKEFYRSLAKSRIYLAHYFNVIGKRQESINYIQRARENSIEVKEKKNSVRLKAFIASLAGDIFQSFNLYDSALSNYQKAVIYAKKNGILKVHLKSLNQIGSLYNVQGDHELARNFYEEVLRVAKMEKADAYAASATHNIAEIYLATNHIDSALKYYKSSYRLRQKNNGPIHTVITSLAKLYAHLKLPDSGFYYLQKLDTTNLKSDDHHSLLSSYTQVFLGNRQFDAATKYSSEHLSFTRQSGDLSWQLEALKNAIEISKAKGDRPQALKYFEELRLIENNLFSIEKSKALLELNTRYQTEQKEQKIASLAQKNRIQTLQLSQQRIVFTASVAILLLILVLGILLFRQHRSKHLQRQLSIEQNLLRTQMNPHFIFNALASIQGFITQDQKREAARYLAKFGKLTRDILEMSRKELIPLTKELEMMTNYVQLEQIRFSKSLDLEITQEGFDDSMEVLIPPMLMQPFLENAIKHGFDQRDTGKITVAIRKKQELLRVSIEDNGIGLDETKPKKERSLATVITNERLQHLRKYGKNLMMKIVNKRNSDGKIAGVIVTMDLPIIYGH